MKKTDIPPEVDAVVIGAGLGGLVCALEMQKSGMNVCLVEKRSLAGGYAHHFRRGKYRFDASLHHLGGLGEGSMTWKMLQSLGVLAKLEYDRQENFIICEFPDHRYTIPNDASRSLEYLGGLFPHERKNLERFYEYSARLKDHVIGPVLYRDFAVPLEKMLSLENVDASFEDLLARYISDDRLKSLLGQLWMYLGLPPSASAANFSNCVFASGFLEGSYHLRGGSQALTDAVAERFREEGGILLLQKGAVKIDVRDKKAIGVHLQDGGFIKAGFIASNASPLSIFSELVETGESSPIFRHRLELMEPSCSAYTTYLGLDCQPSSLGIRRET